jgi:phosphatidylglycerol---prolipoprotein diacylglyceryl transferase
VWPVFYQFGPFDIFGFEFSLPINAFGTMMALAFLASRYVTSLELERKGLDPELGWTFMFWAAVGGLVGARIWILLQDPAAVVRNPLMIVSGAGFVWYGGLLGGTVAVSWIILQSRLHWLVAVDCIAPALAIGHAIGRIGCQLAGDGDWGKVSNLPWAMAYPNAIIGWDYPPGVRVHPAPVYEMLANLGIFAVLWSIRKRPQPAGTVLWWYLLLSAASRFLVEFVRINHPVFVGLTVAQLFSLLLIAVAGGILLSQRVSSAGRPVLARANSSRKR